MRRHPRQHHPGHQRGARQERLRGLQLARLADRREHDLVYGLWCLPKVFRNCVYLDFIYLGGKWPTKPEGGYKASHGDCCEMLCPCVFPKYAVDEKGEVDVKVTSETAAA